MKIKDCFNASIVFPLLVLWFITIYADTVGASTIQGHFYLENQTDHSGIKVILGASQTIPAFTFSGIGILVLMLGFLLKGARRKMKAIGLGLLLTGVYCYADVHDETATESDGSFVFTDVSHGVYRIEASRECYKTEKIDPVNVYSDLITPGPITLPDMNLYNESRMPCNLLWIDHAQIDYNNNSCPHTFTGELSCLCSGNGAGGVPFLPADFADGMADGYVLELSVSEPVGGSHWNYWVSAYPEDYGCSGRFSYYSAYGSCMRSFVRGADIGGEPGYEDLPVISHMEPEPTAYWITYLIYNAEFCYYMNSLPHTYTGKIGWLETGHGAGEYSFLCPIIEDGQAYGYQYYLEAGDYYNGTYHSFWAAAWPIEYGDDTIMSFYVDDSGIIRSGDVDGEAGSIELPVAEPYDPVCPPRPF